MSTIQQIKSRIKSVKSTIKVTKVMQLIAAGKFRNMRSSIASLEKYRQNSKLFTSELLNNLAVNNGTSFNNNKFSFNFSTLFQDDNNIDNNKLMIIIGSNRGLCGQLNSASLKKLFNDLKKSKDKKIKILCIGSNIQDVLLSWLQKNSMNIGITSIIHPDIDTQINSTARKLAFAILKEINSFEKIQIYYTHFFSALKQEFRTELISLKRASTATDITNSPNYIIDGKIDEISTKAIEKFILSECQYFLRHTLISEQALRMNIMDSATNNGNEVVKKLLLRYNKARQANITNELIDIISAANAIK